MKTTGRMLWLMSIALTCVSSTEVYPIYGGCVEPIIQNGFYNTQSVKSGPLFPSGSVITVSCNNEYMIDGETVLTCGLNDWDSQIPVCKKISVVITESGCAPPSYTFVAYSPILPYYRHVYQSGEKITYFCNGDDHALGHNTAECLSSGEWSKKPSCPIKCRRPQVLNGRINKMDEFFTQNQVIKVICDKGYLVVGKKTARCQYDGTWSRQLRCTDGCYQPNIYKLQVYPVPVSGGNVYEIGKRVNFRCDAGYYVTETSAECRGKNRWDKTIPTCKLISDTDIAARIGCPRPALADGLILKNEVLAVYPYKTQFEFQCEKGFNMIGSAVSICRKHLNGPLGGLDPLPPRCERVKCGSPGKPQNGRFKGGDKGTYSFRDTVYYECDDKYIMSGSDHITCQEDGQFNGLPPTCQPPSCRVECVFVDGRECQCDATCRIRGDCCYDFEQHCRYLFYR